MGQKIDTWNYWPPNTTLKLGHRFLIFIRSKYHYKNAPFNCEITGEYSVKNARETAKNIRKPAF
jgi:hypothetical protein